MSRRPCFAHWCLPIPTAKSVGRRCPCLTANALAGSGGDDPDARDVIEEALARRDGGQHERAEAVLRGVAEWDPRCLDAHAHLGLLAFAAGDVDAALAHYATGVWVAEQSLPENFDGVLSWGGLITARFCAACMG
jgi:hypothetical protein